MAAGQKRGAMNVRGQIAVAEIEPRLAAIAPQPFERGERVAGKPPAGGGVYNSRQRIDDGINIRANREAVQFGVVAGIDDDGKIFRRHGARKSQQEFGGSDSSCQRSEFYVRMRHEMEPGSPHRQPRRAAWEFPGQESLVVFAQGAKQYPSPSRAAVLFGAASAYVTQ